MQATNYEMYEAVDEEANQGCEGLRAPRLRDMTSKQKCSTRARYRRRSSAAAGASGSHRRRHKASYC